MKKRYLWMGIWVILAICAISFAGCSSPAARTPAEVTVVQTVPVEVTKLVEITREVEVTREVVVTQVVQVPVTPKLEEGAATQSPSPTATFVINLTPTTPQATPEEKGTGYTPVFVYNQTKSKVDLSILGPTTLSLALWPGDVQKIWVLAGAYDYSVLFNGQEGFSGRFKIVNPDKHELRIYDNKAILRGP